MRRLVLLLLLCGCAKNSDDSVITRRLEGDVNSLNPLRLASNYEMVVARLLYTPLVDLDGEGNVLPAIASRWSVSPDRLEYTFHLDRRATFSDGSRVTANDVRYTLEAVTNPATQSPLMRRFDRLDLSGTTTPDAETIVVRFREALAPQLTNFASLYIVPAKSRAGDKDAFVTTALGSGPYVLEQREIGRAITLKRRSGYWRQPPGIERIRFNVIADNNTAWNALRLGDLDESPVGSDTWRRERNSAATKHLRFLRFFELSYNLVIWNCSREGLDDPRVRRALAQAVDVESIIGHLYEDAARPINGHFPPNSWAADSTVPLVRFDPAAARSALRELGWGGKKPLKIDLLIPAGSRTTSAVAEVVQRGLLSAGVDATVTQLEWATYYERILAGNFDGAYLAWNLDIDPDPYGMFHSASLPPKGKNLGRFRDDEVDRLIDEGRRAATRAERQKVYHRLHRRLADQQPYLWLLQPATIWALNERVENVRPGRATGLFLWYPADQAWTLRAR